MGFVIIDGKLVHTSAIQLYPKTYIGTLVAVESCEDHDRMIISVPKGVGQLEELHSPCEIRFVGPNTEESL